MQVEVSKHTEGAKENSLRPNGLPESLIRYDGTHYSSTFPYVLLKVKQIVDGIHACSSAERNGNKFGD